ncbi:MULTISPECIES: osmoprotectant ABC transporter substrate-binding protein [Mammaliicoccus]|jgi:osmoprotectant transport system substrate-binding protein|uniref:Osmoprotectant ABC transporter substrate-binding protein n=1 Tax=Mammaliicoccus lentus TaxID=42858 RepID=A0AAP1RTH1_MAMLE|nr:MULTISPECIES: osmoprotectant ABC transporter substrate-binding protein [Mammaliicoccus]HBV04080.1 osmoprotectant ABC transporter substrate-binding protein [Staphylococcus sp.]MBF0750360.1 osmoprotectant ABC transporter substrate-binding protein [Mammaliicoccus lentus]MBF0793658.1 osmoprotectant ABC transporter substrate-binding protein [Mammaliicoccus lentus]MBF0842585.1 osmoprotectant ABC transporter substrate-binding protein [Mammaliicoccus lentus]MBU6113826.1 osmoprotectant ABC transport
MKKYFKLFIPIVTLTVILSGCSLPFLGGTGDKNSVKIGMQNTSESQIIGHIDRLMIEHEAKKDNVNENNIQMINNLGSSTVTFNAMNTGDANISSARYTGTDLTGALNMDPITDPDKALKVVRKAFDEDYNQKWYGSYGFENTYAMMVTKETAEKYNLKKVSDMKNVADKLEAGVDSSWMKRPGDGYPAFKEKYGFDFKRTRPMQIGLVYDALNTGKMDVVLGYTTDGRIASYDLVVLEDDLRFFPPYDASPLVTEELIKEKPYVDRAMKKLEGKISTEQMQKLNYEADNNLKEPAVVAEEFLKKHNYFDDEKDGE